MHSLLKRQVMRQFNSIEAVPAELARFVSWVNDAYHQFDDDRNLLERSLELSSEELLQANSELRAIFQALPDLFIIIDAAGRILDVKAGDDNDLLLSPAKLIGKNIFSFYPEEVGNKFLQAIAKIQAGAPVAVLEYTMTLGGKIRVYETRLLPLREHQFLAVVRNITDQKEAEQALIESEVRYRKMLESSPDPIIVYDTHGRTTYINPAFTKVFGWDIDDVYMEKVDYVPDECREEAAGLVDLILSNEEYTGVETRRTTKDGQTIDVSISGSVWHNAEGEPAGSVVILRDITEKKAMEARLIRAYKMEAIGILAGGIAHDFNNLLMGLQGTASLMLSETDRDHPFSEKLNNMARYIRSGAQLTKQLLGFAQGGKYEVRPIDLNGVITETANMFGRTKKQITIDLELAEELWAVEADQVQIEQVLLNLFVNAWQAMPDGGVLTIQTENIIDNGRLGRNNGGASRWARIRVIDTGVGMDDATLQKVFDPFFTTKEVGEGTGLGLASAYGIIQNHGGRIDVRSRLGEGTVFSIDLLASDKSVAISKAVPDRIVNGKGTILLIDDEEVVRDVGREMLSGLGYHPVVAASGREGLDLYRETPDRIDLVILDMVMPEIGGGDVFDRLRVIDSRVRVLLSSGYSIDGQATAILNRGCDGFIQKPFDLKQLSQKIQEVLEN